MTSKELGPSGLHSKLVLKLYSALPFGRTSVLGDSPRTAPLYSTRTNVTSTLLLRVLCQKKSSVSSWVCSSIPGSEFLWQQLGSVTRTGLTCGGLFTTGMGKRSRAWTSPSSVFRREISCSMMPQGLSGAVAGGDREVQASPQERHI